LPFRLYAGDANWVPPLRRLQKRLFAGRTAFFDHAEMALFLAERDGRTVGRIAAIHNKAHNDHHGDRVGFFGFFECEAGDDEAARSLVARAEGWLGERGLEAIRGPVNPSMNAECALLVEGFDRPPMPMMPYNPQAYAGLFESAGLRKCKDLYAYWVEVGDVLPGTQGYERIVRVAAAARRRRADVVVRCLDMSRYEDEILRFTDLFEQARSNNWGHVPLTRKEVLETAAQMKQIVDPQIVIFAEVDGQPAGASLAIPNVNRALAAARGRLLPLGFLRFHREMRRVREIRIFGIGALRQHRARGITVLLYLETILRGLARGYRAAELSWILEDNLISNQGLINTFGSNRYKTYRMYEKPIGAAP
jgi:hypothetical protein